MTPKEKAKQLYDKMEFETKYNSQPSTVHGMCKKLSLICVDEMMKVQAPWINSYMGRKQFEELQEIKQEIEKL